MLEWVDSIPKKERVEMNIQMEKIIKITDEFLQSWCPENKILFSVTWSFPSVRVTLILFFSPKRFLVYFPLFTIERILVSVSRTLQKVLVFGFGCCENCRGGKYLKNSWWVFI